MKFNDIEIGAIFVYDGERFEKSTASLAWSIRGCAWYKEWAFLGDEEVKRA